MPPELIVPLTLSKWLRENLVDPLSKKSFIEETDEGFKAPCGLKYSRVNGVPDFRVKLTRGAGEWLEGQKSFESWIDSYFDLGEKDSQFYLKEQAFDGPMYETLKLDGRVLDVGGQLGHVRKYMDPGQEYCSIDPFIGVSEKARGRENLFMHYPLSEPLNFIGGFAEFLPIKDGSFDTVNMRSCIDHFFNPEIALLESFRVLKPGGKLIVGLTIHGRTVKSRVKEIIRPFLSLFNRKYKDYHVWHPSYDGLLQMCESCGFKLEKVVWQTKDILYASFKRQEEHMVKIDQLA